LFRKYIKWKPGQRTKRTEVEENYMVRTWGSTDVIAQVRPSSKPTRVGSTYTMVRFDFAVEYPQDMELNGLGA